MSAEKANVLRGLGARIIRTPNEAAFDAPESHISVAKGIHERGEAILLDQYTNPSNPLGKKILNTKRTESGNSSKVGFFLESVRILNFMSAEECDTLTFGLP